MIQNRTPKLFRVRTVEDLDRIPFANGMAAVEVPAELLEHLELKHAERGDSERLQTLMRSIRSRGYEPIEPITARVGRRGRWIVINGGHRITAARRVMGEFWSNLFGKKINSFYFILFTNEDSWSKSQLPDGVSSEDLSGSDYKPIQDSWERSEQRNHVAAENP